jgi:hypothetical protein
MSYIFKKIYIADIIGRKCQSIACGMLTDIEVKWKNLK